MTPPLSVLQRFEQHIQDRPDQLLYVFVDGKGRDQATTTYRQFGDATSSVARFLIEDLGLEPGDRVLLVYPPSLDFVTAFIGCLVAGIMPVPVAPPNPMKLNNDLKAFESVAANSGSVAILTDGSYLRAKRLAAAKDLFARRGGAWSNLPWHRTDRLRPSSRPFPFHVPELEDTAFLQYTSGSTSSPKGVMITHGNILHQLAINSADLGLGLDSRSVMWVPHFHDFGLVSGILSALHGNGALYMMSPLSFLRRPYLWFDVMSRIRATHTAAPDFAYRLAVRKTTTEQRQGWDLSTLKVAMSAAEPIRASTVDGFLTAFTESQFSPEAFCPAYGLAEHTVGVSVFGRRRLRVERDPLEHDRKVVAAADDDADALTLFGCGPPSEAVDVRIVDPESRQELSGDQVGEIWVDSPSKAAGYYGLDELSEQAFRARLAGASSTSDRGYLRTGDLGFCFEGEVFVTGRIKDLIILRGRNLYPQDLEESVFSSHELIRPGRAVAFSAPPSEGNGHGGGREREQIVMMTEVLSKKVTAQQLDEVVRAARSSVQHDHGISCDVLLVAQPGEILKTTSGKVRRQACRQAYLDGTLQDRLLCVDVKPPHKTS